jgi:DNA-binding LacI/PurR family transcriptional regulator
VVHKATAQDVADLAGVSRSAVSLVLNGRAQGHIARDKQRAIIDAARRLNYTPNAVALSLRNGRSRTIGVLTSPGASGFADRAMAEQAVTMTLRRFDEDSEGQISQYSFSCRAAIRDSVARPRRPQRPPCRPADSR